MVGFSIFPFFSFLFLCPVHSDNGGKGVGSHAHDRGLFLDRGEGPLAQGEVRLHDGHLIGGSR